MSSHDQRLRKIGLNKLPRRGTDARLHLEKMMEHDIEENPKLRSDLDRKFKMAMGRITTQLANGAGLAADETLRLFLAEYNRRLFSFGVDSMPSSFNVIEAFLNFNLELFYFELLPEVDFLFSFPEFCEYLTAPSANHSLISSSELLEEDTIYNFTITNDIDAITFSMSNGDSHAVAGVTLVKRGHEVSILLLGGQQADIQSKSNDLIELGDAEPWPGKEDLYPSPELKREAAKLLNTDGFWQTLAILRIDLEKQSIDVRYVHHDIGDSYLVTTDDISGFLIPSGKFESSNAEQVYRHGLEEITKYDVLFHIATHCIHLPSFFEANEQRISFEQHTTEFGLAKPKSEIFNKDRIDPKIKIRERTVSVLDAAVNELSDKLIMPENVIIERTGYWKKLPHDKVGTDKQGRQIHGRTWVEQTLSWQESFEGPIQTVINRQVFPCSGKPGFIYVMRNASHSIDIFKVGMTTRSSIDRAKELSSATGVPDKFLIVNEWKVNDCVLAEKIIHKALDQYRVNSNREFFKIKYAALVKITSDSLKELLIDHQES